MKIVTKPIYHKDAKALIRVGVAYGLRDKYPALDKVVGSLIDADRIVKSSGFANVEYLSGVFLWALGDLQCRVSGDDGHVVIEVESCDGRLIEETSLSVFLRAVCDPENLFFIDCVANPKRQGCFFPPSETPRTTKLYVEVYRPQKEWRK